MQQTTKPWSVPVGLRDIPEKGRHFELVADAPARAEIARLGSLESLPRLQASFDVRRQGSDGLHVSGTVSATVRQACVVTAEPLENMVEELVDLVFLPPGALDDPAAAAEVVVGEQDDGPEDLVNGTIDLAEIATEFLMLGVDPYPRKPGVEFQAATAGDEEIPHPFAALAALKARKGGPGDVGD
jgi:uncharacterized metal-binding protein YceD (DUF177 family)